MDTRQNTAGGSTMRGALLASILLTVPGCGGDDPVAPVAQSTGPSLGISLMAGGSDPRDTLTAEGELLGFVYNSAGKDTASTLFLTFDPSDAATNTIQPNNIFRNEQWLDPNHPKGRMIEYFYPPGGGPCGGSVGQYQQGQGGSEVHPPGPGQSPTGLEGHCILPGRYEVTITRSGQVLKTFFLRYFLVARAGNGTNVQVTHAGGGDEFVETTDSTAFTNNFHDVWVNVDVDVSSRGGQKVSVLQAENAGSDPAKTVFQASSLPGGSNLDFFRLSVRNSVSGWAPPGASPPGGLMLTRLFWNLNNPELRTLF